MEQQRVVSFVPSQRGGQLLELNGYLLSINRKNGDRWHWKCRTRNCAVTAITDNNILLKTQGQHTHMPDETKIQEKKCLHTAKEDAVHHPFKSMKRVFSDAFAETVQDNNEEALDGLPSMKKYRCTLYRARGKRLPQIPHTRQEIDLQGQWSQTKDGRPFLLANDGEENRILIFGTTQNLRHLCVANDIYMDGTFKSAPEMYRQVYSIHCQVMGCMIPVIVAFLPTKDEVSYTRMFQLLQQAAQRFGMQLKPNTVSIDFEMAMINTVQQFFPNSRIRGCLFHYSQAVWRKVQHLGLTVRYREDREFNRLVRRASALPLIPVDSVHDVWMEAMNEVNDAAATQFMDYMTETWVDDVAALFPMELWNHYENLEGYRTNNHLEAWHSVLNRELGRPHPNIYRLIEILQEKQEEVDHQVRLLQAGAAPPTQRAAYRQVTDRLIRLKTRLENNEIAVYHYAGAVAGALKQGLVRH